MWFNFFNLVASLARAFLIVVLLPGLVLTQLNGCSTTSSHRPTDYDAAPKRKLNPNHLHNAVPRKEAYHPYGTKDYTVRGKRYKVLKSSKGYVMNGYASWYGTKFHGRQTATQEKYNLYTMTAASPELPLPTYVEVTNLQNGKKVIVRVNDRGPFHKNRIIDLSYAAAVKLGFAEQGVAPVRIVAIDTKNYQKTKPPSTSSTGRPAAKKTSGVTLQLGAFVEQTNAQKLLKQVRRILVCPVRIEYRNGLYRVLAGPITDPNRAVHFKQLLKQNDLVKGILIVEE